MSSKKALAKAAEIEKRLAALQGPEWDSDSDDESKSGAGAAGGGGGAGAEAAAAPKLSKNAKKRAAAEKRALAEKSRVIYVGHVPHGFYEDQMRGFFSQFGDVTNLRLSRSKKTGGSKGYGFIQFADSETAKVAAETMDKYLMHGKQLVAHVAPLALANHPKLFAGSDRKFLKRRGAVEERDKATARNAEPKTDAQKAKATKALVKAEKKKRKRLAENFPGFDFPGYEGAIGDRRPAGGDDDAAPAPEAPKAKKAKKKAAEAAAPEKGATKKQPKKKQGIEKYY